MKFDLKFSNSFSPSLPDAKSSIFSFLNKKNPEWEMNSARTFAKKKGLGVVSLGSKMIDPPVVKRAQKTINMAIVTGLVTKNWNQK